MGKIVLNYSWLQIKGQKGGTRKGFLWRGMLVALGDVSECTSTTMKKGYSSFLRTQLLIIPCSCPGYQHLS